MFESFMAGAHRLSRVNYAPRAVAFAISFVIIALLAQERGWGAWYLAFPALYLLLYPHLLVVAGGFLSATARFETRAILADSLILGFLAAFVNFYLWLSFGFMVAIALNASVVGGSRQLLLALLLYTTGAIAGGILNDWQVQIDGPFYLDIMTMALLLGYVLGVGFLAYNQNARLVSTTRGVEERNRVFQVLVEISSSADLVGEVQDFIHDALQRIHDLYPKYGLGMVVRDVKRPGVLRFVEFVDISVEEQDALVKYLSTTRTPDSRELTWINPDNGAIFQMVFDNSRVRGNEGIIVVRARAISSLLREAARLALEMLGVHVENKMLALDLKHAAERDPLTGVFNRGRLDAELASAIRSRKQHGAMEFAVLMIDVIGLKGVNDKYGHVAGDSLIRETAVVLQEVCRATDVFGRYGGDEFVIICRGSSLTDAQGLRERIKRDVSGRKIRLATGAQETATAYLELSIGLASSSEVEPEEVLAAADEDMYRDKKEWYATHERYR
ncbi:sensor domain-containing diguanylate cyclase [Kangiella koreensis]|uniref:diguanylate cyclase n=1 Tax=Kangiella koreensis (strain DSM 16069 / JCM 12317 / KCTC 12182 / SW-125) TaxID=523791 RepID=C7R671_KANKD|nr:GGDEF domain-containing protein [Kangiella koreensis]ACV25502.1 diguanylate cyclase [Kangiella koreensis DSM 16069]